MSRSALVWTLAAMAVLSSIVGWFALAPARAYWRAEGDAISQLSNAGSMDELASAAGGLGVVLRLLDGAWIAIRYSDSHGNPFFSCSVARTSDGRWLRSRRHYCALFSAYRSKTADLREFRDWGPDFSKFVKSTEEWLREDDPGRLWAAEHAATMNEAVEILQSMEFETFHPTANPVPVVVDRDSHP